MELDNLLDDTLKFKAVQRMKQFGGHFASGLGEAWMRADAGNRARLEAAFPELFERYSNQQGS